MANLCTSSIFGFHFHIKRYLFISFFRQGNVLFDALWIRFYISDFSIFIHL